MLGYVGLDVSKVLSGWWLAVVFATKDEVVQRPGLWFWSATTSPPAANGPLPQTPRNNQSRSGKHESTGENKMSSLTQER